MELEMVQINEMVYSTCKSCVFIERDKNGEQEGCFANRLETFSKKELCCDETGDSFFVMDGSLCHYKRVGDTPQILTKEEKQQILDKVKEDVEKMKPCFSAILLIDRECSFDNFKWFVDNMSKQEVRPEELIILIKSKKYPKRTDMIKYLNENLGFKYRIVVSISDSIPSMIDEAVKQSRMNYYTIFNIFNEVKPDFFKKLSEYSAKNKFVMIEPVDNEDSFLTVMRFAHDRYGGNKEAVTSNEYGIERKVDSIVDKIRFICQEQNRTHYIKGYHELG